MGGGGAEQDDDAGERGDPAQGEEGHGCQVLVLTGEAVRSDREDARRPRAAIPAIAIPMSRSGAGRLGPNGAAICWTFVQTGPDGRATLRGSPGREHSRATRGW